MNKYFSLKEKIIIYILLTIITFLLCYSIAIRTMIFNCDKLEYVNFTPITTENKVYKYLEENRKENYQYEVVDKTIIRKNIKNELGVHFSVYIGRDHLLKNGKAWGYTNFAIRGIVVCEKLGTEDYITTVAHEYVHLKNYNINEMWSNFEAFKFLYNSKNKDFKQAAINFAYDYVVCHTIDRDGNFITNKQHQEEYDIAYYVINYLNDII